MDVITTAGKKTKTERNKTKQKKMTKSIAQVQKEKKSEVPSPPKSAVFTASTYSDPLIRECCTDGMKPTLLSYTCEVRSEYIVDGDACAEAFKRCCKIMEREQQGRKVDQLVLARSKEH